MGGQPVTSGGAAGVRQGRETCARELTAPRLWTSVVCAIIRSRRRRLLPPVHLSFARPCRHVHAFMEGEARREHQRAERDRRPMAWPDFLTPTRLGGGRSAPGTASRVQPSTACPAPHACVVRRHDVASSGGPGAGATGGCRFGHRRPCRGSSQVDGVRLAMTTSRVENASGRSALRRARLPVARAQPVCAQGGASAATFIFRISAGCAEAQCPHSPNGQRASPPAGAGRFLRSVAACPLPSQRQFACKITSRGDHRRLRRRRAGGMTRRSGDPE